MTDINEQIAERVTQLERWRLIISTSAITFGACTLAYLGYQSSAGIPKAVESALANTAVREANEVAKALIEEIRVASSAAEQYSLNAEEKVGEIDEIINSLRERQQQLEQFEPSDPVALANKSIDAIARRVESISNRVTAIESTLGKLDEWRKDIDRVSALVDGRPVRIANNCSDTIRLAVQWVGPFGQPSSGAWWTLSGGETSFLARNDERIILTDERITHYAETIEAPKQFWRGDIAFETGQGIFRGREMELDAVENYYEGSLSCDQ